MHSTPDHSRTSTAQYAWRIVFACEGEQLTVHSVDWLAKRVMDSEPGTAGSTGRFVELRDSNGKVLYRRCISQLLASTVEHPGAAGIHTLERTPISWRREVSVLVPDLPGGVTVGIVAAGPAAGPAAAGASRGEPEHEGLYTRDLATVDLAQHGCAS